MSLEFASEQDLFERLTHTPGDVVFLVGSALTAPTERDGPGVPGVEGVIEMIRATEYAEPTSRERFEAKLQAEPENRYQAAFKHLAHTRGVDAMNRVVRRCVLKAWTRPLPAEQALDDAALQRLEDDLDGWHLSPGVQALGRILASGTNSRRIVLTSNFDPLVAVSVRRHGGSAFSVALHGDGGFVGIDGRGCAIVHFHGDWLRSDTLHTPTQLGQARPKLRGSLRQLLSGRTIVVLGYSGWDDVFTQTLRALIDEDHAPIDVLWTFFSEDERQLRERHARLLGHFTGGQRVMLYKGVDVHHFLPRLADALAPARRQAADDEIQPPSDNSQPASPPPVEPSPSDVHSNWWMNTHKGGEVLTVVKDDAEVVSLQPWAPPVRLSDSCAMSSSNRALHRWRDAGNAMRMATHPWDHAGSALYRHEHGSHPRMLVFRTASPPALLKYGAHCDLTRADIELEHNELARRFIAEEKLVRIGSPAEPTLDAKRYSDDLLAAGIAGVIDLGYFGRGGPIMMTDPVTGRQREATTEEYVASLVLAGRRSFEIGLEVPVLEQHAQQDWDLLKVGPSLVAFTLSEFSEIHHDGLTTDEARLYLRHCVATGVLAFHREYKGGLFVGTLPSDGEGPAIPSTPSPHLRLILGSSGWPTEATWQINVHNLSADPLSIDRAALLWRFRDNGASARLPIPISTILRPGNEFSIQAVLPLERIKEFARSLKIVEPGKVDHAWIFAVLEVEAKLAIPAAVPFRVFKELPTLHDSLRDKRRFLYDPLAALRSEAQRARRVASAGVGSKKR